MDQTGDGTTTAAVLARVIFLEGYRAVAAGMNRVVDKAVKIVLEHLAVQATLIASGSKDGVNYYTKSQDQHSPQHGGSCWEHSSASKGADRQDRSRSEGENDIKPSVQHVLNDGGERCCHGDAVDGHTPAAEAHIRDEHMHQSRDTTAPTWLVLRNRRETSVRPPIGRDAFREPSRASVSELPCKWQRGSVDHGDRRDQG